MEIYEITIDGEVYVSMECGEPEFPINTTVLENNLYGKTKFLENEIFLKFTEEGPEELLPDEMKAILLENKE